MLSRGVSLNLKSRILDRIDAQPGKVWTSADFLDFGPRAAIHKALQRLVRTQDLTRVNRGLFYRSTHLNSLTGKPTVPDHNAILNAIARRDQTRIVSDGITAANDLGLTTAVPARVTVLSDARLRPIRLGNQQIRFQTAAPSRLYWANRPGMRIVQALYWLQDTLGSDHSTTVKRLRTILSNPDHGPALRDDLRQGLHTLPTWMQSIIRELLDERSSGRSASGQRQTSTASIHH